MVSHPDIILASPGTTFGKGSTYSSDILYHEFMMRNSTRKVTAAGYAKSCMWSNKFRPQKGYIEDKYFLDIGFLIGNIRMNMRNTS